MFCTEIVYKLVQVTQTNKKTELPEWQKALYKFTYSSVLSVRDYFLLEITIAAPASATPASARPAVAPVAATLSEAAAEEVAAVLVVPAFEDVAAVEVAAAEDVLESSFLLNQF